MQRRPGWSQWVGLGSKATGLAIRSSPQAPRRLQEYLRRADASAGRLTRYGARILGVQLRGL
eukprot:1738239-Alexandrium_andersonii.AAC.1